jgi:hypothetical protein
MQAFDAIQTQTLTHAFDRAWDKILRESQGTMGDVHSARDLLAKHTLLLAEHGETDEWRLARAAVIYFRGHVLEEAERRRLSRKLPTPRRRAVSTAPARQMDR